MQQLFRLLIFLNSPILRSTFWLYLQFLVQCTDTTVGSSVGALYQKLYMHSKSSPEDGRICRPKHVELI